MASRSSWPAFPPITLSALTRDRRHRQDDESCAADLDDSWVKSAASQPPGLALEPVRNREAPGCRRA
jgi:hypothetical protein